MHSTKCHSNYFCRRQQKIKNRCENQTFYPRDIVNAVYAKATWLAGWVSVHHTPVLYQNG